ncbi:hypothetical protein Pisl_0360 [Pyrobaculum islandicum DSM 4184]|uniref:Uncharacterized protein n=1 Tax=Pyrobaculum islandicum (strain DSM 4184 / JCM 9189 / GEO3) TaxID=384616 RepID=A1RRF6_PYRIL|nr:hypothetical protein [Pyrobaculum islandicum]ABL87538.1 hypothetical protein Pisl_0360 [Pyrobaculum islandicum DSM 4184]
MGIPKDAVILEKFPGVAPYPLPVGVVESKDCSLVFTGVRGVGNPFALTAGGCVVSYIDVLDHRRCVILPPGVWDMLGS